MRMLIALTGDMPDSEYDRAIDFCRNNTCYDPEFVERVPLDGIDWLAKAVGVIAEQQIDGIVFMHGFNERFETKALFDLCAPVGIPAFCVNWNHEIKQ